MRSRDYHRFLIRSTLWGVALAAFVWVLLPAVAELSATTLAMAGAVLAVLLALRWNGIALSVRGLLRSARRAGLNALWIPSTGLSAAVGACMIACRSGDPTTAWVAGGIAVAISAACWIAVPESPEPGRSAVQTPRVRQSVGDLSLEELLAWIKTDDAVTDPSNDLFGHDQLAGRIARRLRTSDRKPPSMALLGPLPVAATGRMRAVSRRGSALGLSRPRTRRFTGGTAGGEDPPGCVVHKTQGLAADARRRRFHNPNSVTDR
jgi:hypothetical protein